MERIKSLYSVYSRYEQRIFKTYLSAFHLKGENKALQLVELIEKDPRITLEQASQKLYKDPRSKAFLMMKARLYEKMTEFLSLSISASAGDSEEIDQQSHILLEYRKNMLAAHALRMRGLKPLAFQHLEAALEIAREISCPELEVDPTLRLKALRPSGKPDPEHNSLFLELSDILARLETDLHAIAIYSHFMELYVYKNSDMDNRLKYLEHHIPQIEHQLQLHYSPRAEYYLLSLKNSLYNWKNQYDECKRTLQRLIELVGSNKGLQNPERMGHPWQLLSLLEASAGKWEEAQVALQNAMEINKDKPSQTRKLQDVQNYIYIYTNQAAKAMESSGRQMQETRNGEITVTSIQEAANQYIHACAAFLLGKKQLAWNTMQSIVELNFDKAGWTTGFRVFDIILLIEMNEPDMASLRVETLRKHLSRYPPDERFHVIFRLLAGMEKNGFNNSHVRDEEELLELLENKYPWRWLGVEVIRFDHWFRRYRGLPLS